MFERIASLFVLKSGFEAGFVIYALGLGGALRGFEYLKQYPGILGWLLFAACLITVLIAGASMVDGVRAWRARRPGQPQLARVVARARLAPVSRPRPRRVSAPARNESRQIRALFS